MPKAKPQENSKANRKYKDTVFTRLFGEPKTLLELYNAISGKNYSTNSNIKIVTLSDVLFMERINDIAFVLEDKLIVLIEHQSTINENMPLRMLLYSSKEYERITDKKSIYYTKRITLPAPEFIVLYNGVEPMGEDYKEMRLSDLFDPQTLAESGINLELIVKVYDINKGKNPELAQRSATLNGYEVFISEIRENLKTLSRGEAIKKAVNDLLRSRDCGEYGEMFDFLKNHSSEVESMLLTEWNWDDALSVRYAEGVSQGRVEGREEGIRALFSLLERGVSLKEAKEMLSVP